MGVPDPESAPRFIEAGIPTIRLSNIFIQQELGPEKLRIGQPSNADFSKVPAIREAPEGHVRNREAQEAGHFFAPPERARVFTLAFDHMIDPDRDVNAAGLVYFANFPAFFEVAERRAMAALPGAGSPRISPTAAARSAERWDSSGTRGPMISFRCESSARWPPSR